MWLPIILSIVFVIVLGWAGSRAGGFVEGLYSGRGVESGAIGAASSVPRGPVRDHTMDSSI